MKVFSLPDLGEGLPDAEIVEWMVAVGDTVNVDQPMVSMETAKAVVEVPSPFAGTIAVLHGAAGDVIDTGAALVTFDLGDGQSAADHNGAPTEAGSSKAATESSTEEIRKDSGTVVGVMESSDQIISEQISNVGGVKVTPAVRALAKKLKIDLGQVTATGKNGVITAKDVRKASASGSAAIGGPGVSSAAATPRPAAIVAAPAPSIATGEMTPIRGTRRSMARAMAEAHAQVVPTCITEDADVGLWEGKQDLSARMIRALVAGARREPGLNAWFDANGPQRLIHERVHIGIAVDTADGLFVSTLRDADLKTPAQLREDINLLRQNVENRSIPPKDLTGYTMVLSNVGVFAGKYTTPIVTPPCVCILATGRMRNQVVAAHGGMAVHPVIPLSLTFDHRAVTGGEAARFLAAFIEDITRPY
jgi:2-oxoisovalerate dehydrogenase E2 component (dihydrolipoyl transacylase)